MKNTRYNEGLLNLNKIDGEAGERVLQSLKEVAPDVGKYIIEFAFGDIYSREQLTLREREIITITSLLTQGDTHNQLVVHINGSLNASLLTEEIIEVFIHCIPYVGFPKVLNAISIAKDVFESRK